MDVSTKISAAAVGGAVATIIWVVVASLWPDAFTDAAITSLTGASATVLAFVFGYLVKDPQRQSTPRTRRHGRPAPHT